ncbi:hypothetical protein BGW38_009459, partial [Lunasporangiospora selenospora]
PMPGEYTSSATRVNPRPPDINQVLPFDEDVGDWKPLSPLSPLLDPLDALL